jgi:hypothetical protein
LGGAIYNHSIDNLPVSNCQFSENKASYGGAIYNIFTRLSITGSNLNFNEAVSAGGAIYNDHDCELEVMKCWFSGNKAELAGAIANITSHLTISNSVLLNNSANSFGGAIINHTNAQSSFLNCTFMNNSAAPFEEVV